MTKRQEESKLEEYGLFDGNMYLNPLTGNVVGRTTRNRRRIYQQILEEERSGTQRRFRRLLPDIRSEATRGKTTHMITANVQFWKEDDADRTLYKRPPFVRRVDLRARSLSPATAKRISASGRSSSPMACGSSSKARPACCACSRPAPRATRNLRTPRS